MKTQPVKIHKSFSVIIKNVDEEKREITTVGSQEKLDRDRDVVVVNGIETKGYKRNPVVLWSHRSGDPPIGKTTKVWKEDDKLMFKIQFASMEEYGFADTIYKLIKGGYLSAFSIGFSPDWKQAVFDEKVGGYVFNKVDLLEISVVNVPSNPNALVQSKSIQKALKDNIIDNVELDEFKSYLDKVEEEKEVKDNEEPSVISNPIEDLKRWNEKMKMYNIELGELTEKVNFIEQKLIGLETKYNKDNETYLDQILQELFDSSDTKSDNESSDDLKEGEDQVESLIDDYLGDD